MAVLDGTPDPILVKDAQCRVVLANRAALVALGKSADEVIGRTVLEYIDDRHTGARLWNHDIRILSSGTAESVEEELPHRSGWKTFLTIRSAYRDETGQAAGVIIASRDITEAKRAAEAAKKSEEKFATAFQSSPAAMVISDHAGGDAAIEVNDAFLAMTGYSREEVVGKTHPEVWLWDDPAEYARAIAQFQPAGILDNFEFRFRRKDGEVRTGLISAERIDVNGRPSVLATSIDITDRKRTEEALRRDADRLSLILEATSGAVWEWNIQSGDAVFSREYSGMLGYDPEEFATNYQSWKELVHPDDIERVRQHFAEHFAGRLFSIEFRMREKSGNWHWIHCQGLVVERDTEGRPLRMVGAHSDIDQRKRSEEERERLQQQLAHAQKMECVGRLAGGVAHDFNNLMSVILMQVDSALDEVDGDSSAAESVIAIRDAALRAADVARQLLTFTHKQDLRREELNLNQTIADCRQMTSRLIGEDIVLEFSPGAGLRNVRADRAGIDQIVLNLAVNARDAMPSGGTLRIATSNVDLDDDYVRSNPEAKSGPYVLLRIADCGAGMDAATLARSFEPFFTTKGLGEGTGLGLSVVYGIVKQHRGFITVESERGYGTEFRIFLPAATENSSPETEAGAIRGGAETILLAEDEPELRNKVREVLEGAGYRVLAGSDGEEALQLGAQMAPPLDLLLTDVVMPELSGAQLAGKLRDVHPEMKVLYVSGYPYIDEAAAAVERGPNLLDKPFDREQLLRRVRSLLDGPPI